MSLPTENIWDQILNPTAKKFYARLLDTIEFHSGSYDVALKSSKLEQLVICFHFSGFEIFSGIFFLLEN